MEGKRKFISSKTNKVTWIPDRLCTPANLFRHSHLIPQDAFPVPEPYQSPVDLEKDDEVVDLGVDEVTEEPNQAYLPGAVQQLALQYRLFDTVTYANTPSTALRFSFDIDIVVLLLIARKDSYAVCLFLRASGQRDGDNDVAPMSTFQRRELSVV